jgi:hypothetical protein
MPLLTAAELDQPYSADPRADDAILVAESRILSALRSSPRRWDVPSDLSTWAAGSAAQQLLYAELVSIARKLAHGELTAGRAGAGRITLKHQQDAVRRLKEISTGADLGVGRSSSAHSALGFVGDAEPTLGRLWPT